MLVRDATGAPERCLAVFGPGRPGRPRPVGTRATLAAAMSRDAFDLEWSTCDRARLARDPRFDGWFFTGVDRIIGGLTEGYRRSLRVFLRFRVVAVALFLVGLGLTYFIFQRVPRGFVPNEDQGYFIILVQSPSGASLEYTRNIGKQLTQILNKVPEIEHVFAVSGFSFSGNASNRGLTFATLRPYSQRKGNEHGAQAVLNKIRGPLSGISEALVIPFLPPAVQGLGQFGGFQYELQDQGGHTLQELANVTQDVSRKGNARKELAGVFSSYTANDPQFLVTIDREKAKSLHVPLSQITDTLGVYMGSAYVNDFDFNNRSYRVYVQADKQFRGEPKDMRQFYVRSDTGAMVPLDNLMRVTQTITPQVISHYNLFRSAEIDGASPERAGKQFRCTRAATGKSS